METCSGISGIVRIFFHQPQTIDFEAMTVNDSEFAVESGFAGNCRDPRRHTVGKTDSFDPLFQMQCAGLAVFIDSAPIADTVSCIAVLLYFKNKVARSDSVYCTGLDKVTVAGSSDL